MLGCDESDVVRMNVILKLRAGGMEGDDEELWLFNQAHTHDGTTGALQRFVRGKKTTAEDKKRMKGRAAQVAGAIQSGLKRGDERGVLLTELLGLLKTPREVLKYFYPGRAGDDSRNPNVEEQYKVIFGYKTRLALQRAIHQKKGNNKKTKASVENRLGLQKKLVKIRAKNMANPKKGVTRTTR